MRRSKREGNMLILFAITLDKIKFREWKFKIIEVSSPLAKRVNFEWDLWHLWFFKSCRQVSQSASQATQLYMLLFNSKLTKCSFMIKVPAFSHYFLSFLIFRLLHYFLWEAPLGTHLDSVLLKSNIPNDFWGKRDIHRSLRAYWT